MDLGSRVQGLGLRPKTLEIVVGILMVSLRVHVLKSHKLLPQSKYLYRAYFKA